MRVYLSSGAIDGLVRVTGDLGGFFLWLSFVMFLVLVSILHFFNTIVRNCAIIFLARARVSKHSVQDELMRSS